MGKTKKKTTLGDVLEHIEKYEHRPFMVSEIARKLEATFDTVKDHLLHLAALNHIEMRKVGRHWIFWKKSKEQNEH